MGDEIDVEGWIQERLPLHAYAGDGDFLQGPTPRTREVWMRCLELLKEERARGVLDIDTETVSGVSAFGPGYIIEGKDLIVGLQTDAPLKRACKPRGGARLVEAACAAYGYTVSPQMKEVYTKHRKTHNDGVFDAYDDVTRACRSSHLLTGLPDSYGRGRIIGDYRRVALYGVDRLIEAKRRDRAGLTGAMTPDMIQLREETAEQVKALEELKEMALSYGYDVSRPAGTAREALQWTYFAYLAACKEQDGAAMSFGRINCFMEPFFSHDIKEGKLTEIEAQELIDDFIIKLRLIRHLRTPAFDELFSGNPTWVTMTIAGLSTQGIPQVTKTSFRILNSLMNLGPAPEPNLTVLWSKNLPDGFKRFCARASVGTSSIQYENDDLMRPLYGSDYSIACCVSGMTIGKQMQFFGARCNLPKLLLYVLNGGVDEISAKRIGPPNVFQPFPSDGAIDFDTVWERFDVALEWMAEVYANTMNCIHYMHDRYNYERLEMALHDTHVHRYMAYGCAGVSVVADSFSAIKHARVTAVRNKGLTTDFIIEGSFPKFGNDDDRVDAYATAVTHSLITKLRKHYTYRDAEPTLSVLTITSNVVYGKATGSTPDGRRAGEPFAPGANPMHGRDSSGAIASLNSVAKLDYADCMDGISNTFGIVPLALGKDEESREKNLVAMLDGYFDQNAHHLNVNVLNRETLLEAIENPSLHPQLTIRVSGYAVYVSSLTRAQQEEVLARTFHTGM